MSTAAGLGRQQPDDTVVRQRGQGVDESVDEIAVAFAPPHHHGVDDVVVVLVDEVRARSLGHDAAQLLVAVVVVPDLLDDRTGGDTQLVRQRVLTCRAIGGGAAHWVTLLLTPMTSSSDPLRSTVHRVSAPERKCPSEILEHPCD